MENKKAIILLFLANSISGVAQGISMLAIPWYFAKQEAMGQFGLVYILTNIIAFLWVPFSGTLIDQFNRKHIFLAITVTVGSILLSVAGLGFLWGSLPWYLVAFIFMLTFFNYNIHYPNLYAFIQEITEDKNYAKITSYIEVQGQVTSMLAGAAGAMLLEGTQNGILNVFGFKLVTNFQIAAWNIHEIFLLDAATYVLAFLIISLIKFTPIAKRSLENGPTLERLKAGWQFLMNNQSVFIFGLASYAIFVTVLLEGFYLGAFYVKNHLDAGGDVYAASDMYYAIGAVLAGAGVHWIFRKTTLPMGVIITTIITSLLFAVLGLSKSIFLFYAMLFILGLTNAGTRVMRTTFLFSKVPNQVYGRITSIFTLGNISFRIFFLGIFSIPFFQAGNHVIYAFLLLSVFLLGAAFVLIKFYRSFLSS